LGGQASKDSATIKAFCGVAFFDDRRHADMTEKSDEFKELDEAQQKEVLRLAKILLKLRADIANLDESFARDIQKKYPVNAKLVRSYAVEAIDCFRRSLGSAFSDTDRTHFLLNPALEVLTVELSEVNAGRKSTFFSPNPADSNRVRLTIRALSAAALHVFIEEKLLSLDGGAALVSDVLFEASICRVHVDTKEKTTIPPSTIMDWRNSRESHSIEFAKLFERFAATFSLVAALQNENEMKMEAVKNSLGYLVRLFNYT
jgi:hypothetical protein